VTKDPTASLRSLKSQHPGLTLTCKGGGPRSPLSPSWASLSYSSTQFRRDYIRNILYICATPPPKFSSLGRLSAFCIDVSILALDNCRVPSGFGSSIVSLCVFKKVRGERSIFSSLEVDADHVVAGQSASRIRSSHIPLSDLSSRTRGSFNSAS